METVIHWFRRDLRWYDNTSLYQALSNSLQVLPVFIFDPENFNDNFNDLRADFIYKQLIRLNEEVKKQNKDAGIWVTSGNPLEILPEICRQHNVSVVYANREYEPHKITQEEKLRERLREDKIEFQLFNDHLILPPDRVKKSDGGIYQVFTPYSRQWRSAILNEEVHERPSDKFLNRLISLRNSLPVQSDLGLKNFEIDYPERNVKDDIFKNYESNRDRVFVNGTSRLSVHLRYGTISPRKLFRHTDAISQKYSTELIWREFYASILFHFPEVVGRCFKPEYENIPWRSDDDHLEKWKRGITGIPLVDAGMRELNNTGLMHNRVRMVVSSFLTKNLLIDWRYGEAYFAEKLLDFDLASNNGSWQWAAGCGVDAAPYFRVFNPISQQAKFDPQFKYIKKWVPEYGTLQYPKPIVDLKSSRQRCIEVYKNALSRN
ncbi:MAG: deoxyribodipyrimidine photo-lyase [Bacteroidetes bacterium]|nr:deoxyribodipyrimidine photo-lyase [Bacteroidota bacterium]